MNLSVVQTQGRVPVTVLAIEGKLDGSNYLDLIAAGQKLYQSGTRSLLMDLTNLSYMSSAGIAALHSIAVLFHAGAAPSQEDGWSAIRAVDKEPDGFRKEVKLLNPQEKVDSTLTLSGMKRFLEVFTDFQTAVDSFS